MDCAGVALVDTPQKRARTRAIISNASPGRTRYFELRYAYGCVDLMNHAAKSEASAADGSFRARKAFSLLLDAVRAGAATKRGGFDVPGGPRFPCLSACAAGAVADALADPSHPGYHMAHAYVLRKPRLKPWTDAPFYKDALCLPDACATRPFVAFTPDEKLKKKSRRWAMRVLIDGCRDASSGRLLRDAKAVALLLCHHDSLATGGVDPESGRLAFDGAVPPGANCLLDQPGFKLRRAQRDVATAVRDALTLFDALIKTPSARRTAFFKVGVTSWVSVHLGYQPSAPKKDWGKVARMTEWCVLTYREVCGQEDLLEQAPLFFQDLERGVVSVLDCVTDADDARVDAPGAPPRPLFKKKRVVPFDPLGIRTGDCADPNK